MYAQILQLEEQVAAQLTTRILYSFTYSLDDLYAFRIIHPGENLTSMPVSSLRYKHLRFFTVSGSSS